jgi:hypothetical protein
VVGFYVSWVFDSVIYLASPLDPALPCPALLCPALLCSVLQGGEYVWVRARERARACV